MRGDEYQDAFYRDGSLRDIYVLKTDWSEWQRCLTHIRSHYQTRFTVDSEDAQFPDDIREVFAMRNAQSVSLGIEVDGVWINTHFFTQEEIEFDLDPADVDSPSRAERVLSFMREIGDLLHREVVLTPENAADRPMFRFSPGMTEPEYVP